MSRLADCRRELLTAVMEHRSAPRLPAHAAASPHESDRTSATRRLLLEWCPLTAAVLAHRGCLNEVLLACSEVRMESAGSDEARAQFLSQVCTHPDPLCAAVAAMETALFECARERDAGPARSPEMILWPCDPEPVLRALTEGSLLRTPATQPYVMVVGALDGCELTWCPA